MTRVALMVAIAATLASCLLLNNTPAISSTPQRRALPGDRLLGISDCMSLNASEHSRCRALLKMPLTKVEAERAVQTLSAVRFRDLAREEAASLQASAITVDQKTLRWQSRTFGDAPAGKRSLWISLHGGGNAPAELNDQQWKNQARLYQPLEGIYLAPRAPTDSWNLWQEPHIDMLLQRLIDAEVATNGVDTNRVYLLGYSAGGDGVWQLAPRMADRFAAAAMMAGHPGDASMLPLRNLPFAIFMGGADSAYNRNRLAAEKTAELACLHAADPGGYVYLSRIYPGLPHWMNREDREALPWMASFKREPWPKKVIWVQDDVANSRFYWLEVPGDTKIGVGDMLTAAVDGQTITLSGAMPKGLRLRLSDSLLDLDKPVRVVVNGETKFVREIARTAAAIRASLLTRADPASAATATLVL